MAARPELPHWSFEGLERRLARFNAPDRPFDPAGRWAMTWRTLLLIDSGAGPATLSEMGTLRIERSVGLAGLTLKVEQDARMLSQCTHQARGALRCMLDPVASLSSWELDSVVLDKQGQPEALTQVQESGFIREGRVLRLGSPAKAIDLDPQLPLTSNWSLMEAVQRLSAAQAPPQRFRMLEDLDLLREEQSLRPYGDAVAQVATGPLPMTLWLHQGRGLLPTFYWLDAHHRLLFVTSGGRTLMLSRYSE